MPDSDPTGALREAILSRGNIPPHVAVIMDGNGRWAESRGLPRIAGHHAAVESVRDTVKAAGEIGVKVLTLYTFSIENWKRPKDEVDALMALLEATLAEERLELAQNNVRLEAIGRTSDLPDSTQRALAQSRERLQHNTGMTLVLALSYSGRAEIVDAVRGLLAQSGGDGARIDEDSVRRHLYTASHPDPDLLIRTSGEMRISNFLLWQLAYSEIWITDVLWPDFRRHHLYEGIREYQERERRFGRVSATPPVRSST